MTSRRFCTGLAWAFLLSVLPSEAYAQTGAASITGLIVDQTGASLPGVAVTATNQATNVTSVAMTNGSGNYTITPLVIGTYIVKAELAGFRTSATQPIAVRSARAASGAPTGRAS